MKVVREEIFGPVVVTAPFSDLDEIPAQANDTPTGSAPALPFGGYKQPAEASKTL